MCSLWLNAWDVGICDVALSSRIIMIYLMILLELVPQIVEQSTVLKYAHFNISRLFPSSKNLCLVIAMTYHKNISVIWQIWMLEKFKTRE